MRTVLIGLGAALGFSLFVPSVSAQDAGFSDPFFLYYGYFLPRQNALAAQAQPEDFYRNQSIQRQYAAQTDRAGLYDPISAVGMDELDPTRAFGYRSSNTRMVRTTPVGLRSTVSKTGHSAPQGYFARTSGQGNVYFPTIRSGLSARSRGASSAPSALGGRGMGIPSPAPGPMGGSLIR